MKRLLLIVFCISIILAFSMQGFAETTVQPRSATAKEIGDEVGKAVSKALKPLQAAVEKNGTDTATAVNELGTTLGGNIDAVGDEVRTSGSKTETAIKNQTEAVVRQLAINNTNAQSAGTWLIILLCILLVLVVAIIYFIYSGNKVAQDTAAGVTTIVTQTAPPAGAGGDRIPHGRFREEAGAGGGAPAETRTD